MSDLNGLVENLGPPQQAAIAIVKLALDCFNSKDGSGLFTGASRYSALEARVPIAAAKSRDLFGFWAALLKGMLWSIPPKSADARIVAVLSAPDQQKVLRSLATEPQAVITIARMLHDVDKASRRAFQAPQEEAASDQAFAFNDSLEGI